MYGIFESCSEKAEGTYTNDSSRAKKPAHEGTWIANEDGVTHTINCTACKETVTKNHTGGTGATCSSKAICDFCNQAYGTPDHDNTVAYVNGFCPNGCYEPATRNSNNVYEISNAGQLYWFAALVNDGDTSANAILTDDIEVNTGVLKDDGSLNEGTFRIWTPIGYINSAQDRALYYGTFDGNGKTISGLYFSDSNTDYVGLFGIEGSGGRVQNVGIVDSYFCGGSRVGGVVGLSGGTVTNCYNTGTITGSSNVGGVVGYNEASAVTNCYNTGTVTGSSNVGGVVGTNWEYGIVTNCYNIGSVSGNNYVGGVVGYNEASAVTNCYNTGSVTGSSNVGDVVGVNMYDATATNCYYLSATDDGNGGKTAAQFANGEVAWLLNGSASDGVWKQTLGDGGDAFPNFTGATVYQIPNTGACKGYGYGYSNNQNDVYAPGHTGGEATCTVLAVCEVCSNSYGELNHTSDADDGKCDVCGSFVDGIGARLMGYSISMDGNIGVNFYMELDESVLEYKDAYMQFTLDGKEYQQVPVSEAVEKEVGDETYHVFKCGIPAKDMKKTITARIVLNEETQGTVYSFTVEEYADYILDENHNYDEATKAVVTAMMTYGNYAEAYFDGEALEATEEINQVTADTLARYAATVTNGSEENVASYYGSSLLLRSQVVLRHYFTEAVDGATQSGNLWYLDIANIPAHKLHENIVTKVGDITISYSPLSYAYAVLNGGSEDVKLQNLVKAMYLYNHAARIYAGETCTITVDVANSKGIDSISVTVDGVPLNLSEEDGTANVKYNSVISVYVKPADLYHLPTADYCYINGIDMGSYLYSCDNRLREDIVITAWAERDN